MSLIQTPAFISYCSSQVEMAGASHSDSHSVFEFDSVVRGHHIYKTVWTPVIDEMLQVAQEDTNEHDEYPVAITKAGYIIGHVPRELSRICTFFLMHGTITCRIIGHRKKGVGLKVPCVYTFTSSQKNIMKLRSLLEHGNS